MSFKGQYYIVRKGPELREDYSNVLFTKTRVFSGIDACKQTFGEVTEDMFVKGIGPTRSILTVFKRRVQLMKDPENWIPMAGVMEIVDVQS